MKKSIKNNPGTAATILMVLGAIILGYTLMWLLGSYTAGNFTVSIILTQILLITVALGVAYAILKGIFHVMRLRDRNEKELHLKDMPRDAVQFKLEK